MRTNKRTPAGKMALGGVMAALAVAIMSLGGLIPASTYVCPMLSMLILQLVYLNCGRRVAWAWFFAVAILSLLMSPDKEAAGVFTFLGYYPIVKPWMDRRKCKWLWKLGLFNASVCLLYVLLLHLFGLSELNTEFAEYSRWFVGVLLLLGNVIFALLDRLLGMKRYRRIF